MPQMGESIFEGTITKWLKKVGDTVAQDEPLFEISTDKVDAEIPSPTAGTLTEIKVAEGTTVQINTVVAVIGGTAGAVAAPAAAAPAPAVKAEAPKAAAVPASPAPEPVAAEVEETAGADGVRSSPLVRKIAKENNLDLSKVKGTGSGGRITKEDALAAIAQRGAAHTCGSSRPCRGSICIVKARASRPGDCPRRIGPAQPHAVDHRAAHGRVEAHQPARAHLLQDRPDEDRQASRKREDQVRAAQRREADLHAVHYPRRYQHTAQDAHRQRINGTSGGGTASATTRT